MSPFEERKHGIKYFTKFCQTFIIDTLLFTIPESVISKTNKQKNVMFVPVSDDAVKCNNCWNSIYFVSSNPVELVNFYYKALTLGNIIAGPCAVEALCSGV